ncbi:hypothetical protein D3C84_1168850 [compost metagenome]
MTERTCQQLFSFQLQRLLDLSSQLQMLRSRRCTIGGTEHLSVFIEHRHTLERHALHRRRHQLLNTPDPLRH